MNSEQMTATDWRNFAALSYNVYLVQTTATFFNTAYASYCRILSQKYDLPLSIIHEAAARIINLCRIGLVSNEDDYVGTISRHCVIFQREHGEVWQFWLQQLVELA
jgi:hypothetical protein